MTIEDVEATELLELARIRGAIEDIRGVIMFWGFWVPVASLLIGAIVLIGFLITHH